MNGLFDSLLQTLQAASGMTLKNQLQDQLQKAQYSIEAKLGEFLQSGQIVSDYVARAHAQENATNPDARSRATSLVAKGRALLTNYESVKSEAQVTLAQIGALKTKIETDPAFSFPDMSNVGTRIIEILDRWKSDIGSTAAVAGRSALRLNSFLKDVSSYKSQVEDLENFSQGKGFQNMVGKIGGAYMQNILGPVVKIAAVAGAVYLLAPSLFGRMLRSRK